MGLSSSKTTTVQNNDPWAPAQPYILNGLASTQSVFDHNQGQLQKMGDIAAQAYDRIAPQALGTGDYAKSAQAQAQVIANGHYFGANPGAATYERLQRPAADPSFAPLQRAAGGVANPAADLLGGMARADANPAYATLAAMSGSDSVGAPGIVAANAAAPPAITARTIAPIGIDAADVATAEPANPADAIARKSAAGAYLDRQPSAPLYARIMAQPGLGNPYLDGQIKQANEATARALNARFATAGMGEGLSTPYADLLSKNLAANETTLRYQDYTDSLNRALAAAGQSDAAFAGERAQMASATQQLASNFNARADRQLGAATGNADRNLAAQQAAASNWLTTQQANQNAALDADRTNAANGMATDQFNLANNLTAQTSNASNRLAAEQANQNSRLAAAQALGSQYDAGADRQLQAASALGTQGLLAQAQAIDAAKALGQNHIAGDQTALAAAREADQAQQGQIQQMLAALGLTGDLSQAQYAGVAPALSLLSEAASIPYVGIGALNGNVAGLTSGYNSQTATSTSNPGLLGGLQQAVSLGRDAKRLFSDRRLKTLISPIGRLADGLGVYAYRYVWGGPDRIGVMADEVAKLRPWALGPIVAGFATVDYGAL